MTAVVVPAAVLEAKRQEREQQRRERQVLVGSILAPIDDKDSAAPASPAQNKETHQ